MSNGKYSNRKSGKAIVVLVALVMILAIGIGGTLAYLTTKTETVTNTFVMGDIGVLELKETEATVEKDTEGNVVGYKKAFNIIPGVDITKDPKVTYTPDAGEGQVDVPVYVFVKVIPGDWVKADGNDNTYQVKAGDKVALSWSVDPVWTCLDSSDKDKCHIYYQWLDACVGLTDTPVITGNTITVSGENITMQNIETVTEDANNLSFQAYVIQQQSFADAAAAWDAVKNG